MISPKGAVCFLEKTIVEQLVNLTEPYFDQDEVLGIWLTILTLCEN